jgi:glutamate racemase
MPRPALSVPAHPGVKVGVFDSGVGGLSILRSLRQHLPEAQLMYVADSAHAPYGEKSEAFVIARSIAITEFLLGQGAQVIVVACNTATAAAVHALRLRFAGLPIVGIEPGVKPAVARSRNKRIGVLATPRTLASAKFAQLVKAHAQDAQIVLQPCPGLAAAIETGRLDTPEMRDMLRGFVAPLQAEGVDTIALGCTHYPFVASQLQTLMGPEVHIIDTSEAVALHTRRMVDTLTTPPANAAPATNLPAPADGADRGDQGVRCWTSAEPVHLAQMALAWLGLRCQPERLPV